jgi:hypothetical protein
LGCRISRKKVTAISNHKTLKEVGPDTKMIKDILIINMIPQTNIPRTLMECRKLTLRTKINLVIKKLVKNIKKKMRTSIKNNNRMKVDHKDN